MNTTVIVQRLFEYTLEFPKYERFLRGAEGPILILQWCKQPLLYPPEQTSNNIVGSIGCHRVQTFCEYTLEFPKCERLDKSIAKKATSLVSPRTNLE